MSSPACGCISSTITIMLYELTPDTDCSANPSEYNGGDSSATVITNAILEVSLLLATL